MPRAREHSAGGWLQSLRRLVGLVPVMVLACGSAGPVRPTEVDGAFSHGASPAALEAAQPLADPGASAQEPLAVAPSAALPTVPPPPDLFAPPQYAGSVTVLFHNEPGNETDIRWRAASTTPAFSRSSPSGTGQFTTLRRSIDPQPINALLRQYGVTQVARGLPDLTEQQLTTAYQYMQAHHIPGTYDWNGDYHVWVETEATAKAFVAALAPLPLVRSAAVRYRPRPTGTVGPTPDFTPLQGYLYSNEVAGGLNVVAAWNPPYNLTGAGVHVNDGEDGVILNHEDLPFEGTSTVDATDPDPYHATAVAGVVVGSKNTLGITGISYGSTYGLSVNFGLLAALLANDNVHPDPAYPPPVREGDVVLVEVGYGGPPNGVYDSWLPEESQEEGFLAIQQLTGLGVHVVEGAANGGIALVEWPPVEVGGSQFLTEDSGAIMVGASLGATHAKNPYSNCGPRVDVYAWGAGVVTTGYGDLFPGTGTESPDNLPQWYTAHFAHTSAATAQIGGVVALLQEYVRKAVCPPPVMPAVGDPGKIDWRCYLPPKTMRQLLKDSGVGNAAHTLVLPDPTDATGWPDNIKTIATPDCGIGVQPDVGKALQLLDTGTYKPEIHFLFYPQSPTVVSGIRYDLDGDGRAELISFSRDRKWYVDLSSVGSSDSPDGYGDWDLTFIPSPLAGEGGGEGALPMLFPVVHDYNSDGRADLALYDSTNGTWYLRYTDAALLNGTWGDWDRVIDYSTDPHWQPYSRPVPGDFTGDHWLDPALTTPDGQWLIDDGGFTATLDAGQQTVSYADHFGGFDTAVTFLTDEQLAAAPGWAYVPSVSYGTDSVTTASDALRYKIPDGLPFAGTFTICWSGVKEGNPCLSYEEVPFMMYGGMETQLVPLGGALSAKWPDGTWKVADFPVSPDGWLSIPPEIGYGGINCRPVPADYDGDGIEDRAVQCTNEWRIELSSQATSTGKGTVFAVNTEGFRIVKESFVLDPLPGTVYPGGVNYQDLKAIYEYYSKVLNIQSIFDLTPPPIGPYLPVCLKYWATQPIQCVNY